MYWTFIVVSSILIFPSIFIVSSTLLKLVSRRTESQTLEIAFLRQQLLQIEIDTKKGSIDEHDKSNHISISRRLLKLSQEKLEKTSGDNAPPQISRWTLICVALICTVGTHLIYAITNDNYFHSQNPKTSESANKTIQQFPSQKIAEEIIMERRRGNDVKQKDSEPSELQMLVQELIVALESKPDSLRGQRLLAKNSALLGDFFMARKAQKKVLELLKSEATSSDYANYAEFCIFAVAGYISPEAANAIEKAISSGDFNSKANFYLSLLQLQNDEKSEAFKTWISLLEKESLESKWIGLIIPQINQMSIFYENKLRNNQPPDLAFSSDKSLFVAVLESLEHRLNRQTGKLENWLTLISAYERLELNNKVEINKARLGSKFSLQPSQVVDLITNQRQK